MTDSPKKPLTDKQEAFLEALFSDECFGNYTKAAIKAGYSPNSNITLIARGVKKEIIERTEEYLAMNAPKAGKAFVDAIDTPTTKGIQHAIKGAENILDRIGVVKKQVVEVETEAPAALLILPPKDED